MTIGDLIFGILGILLGINVYDSIKALFKAKDLNDRQAITVFFIVMAILASLFIGLITLINRYWDCKIW